jgi:hypothetical protein
MRIQELHYDVKFKLDKVDSNQKRNFTPAQIDWALNNGIQYYLDDTYDIDPQKPYRNGFEMTERRFQGLKGLHIKSPEQQAPLTATAIDSTTYYVELENLAFEHLWTTRVRAVITDENCTKTVGVSIVETDDLTDAVVDPFNRPNTRFGKALGVYGRTRNGSSSINHFAGNGTLYIYTDGAVVSDVYIDYIKYPNRVWIGTYDLTDDLAPKSASNNYVYQAGVDNPVNCDLNVQTHSKIVDHAVFLLSEGIEDPNLIRLKQMRTLTNK